MDLIQTFKDEPKLGPIVFEDIPITEEVFATDFNNPLFSADEEADKFMPYRLNFGLGQKHLVFRVHSSELPPINSPFKEIVETYMFAKNPDYYLREWEIYSSSSHIRKITNVDFQILFPIEGEAIMNFQSAEGQFMQKAISTDSKEQIKIAMHQDDILHFHTRANMMRPMQVEFRYLELIKPIEGITKQALLNHSADYCDIPSEQFRQGLLQSKAYNWKS